MKKLTIITTDFGADCDDQKAVADAIRTLGADEEIAFIVSGPHPDRAAAAIMEKYFEKTGRLALVAVGQQFEEDKKPADEIFSLVDGHAVTEKEARMPVQSLQSFHKLIDLKIIEGVESLEMIVLAPLHSDLEYYTPHREDTLDNAALHAQWARTEKTATVQFQLADDGSFKGNNSLKSGKGVVDRFSEMLKTHKIEAVFFDGAVAKIPEFTIPVRQDENPGQQKASESYMASMQVPWLYMMEDKGQTPSLERMHAGMFTPGAQFPFGVHVANGTPAGFGAERALKEVCGITRSESEKFSATMQKLDKELEAFDSTVVERLSDSAIASVGDLRAEMHRGMIAALNSFAIKKGVTTQGETISGFTEMFDLAKKKGVNLNAYAYMQDFVAEVFVCSPLTKKITDVAAAELRVPRADGRSHTQAMAGILSENGARAIVYDAVAVASARVLRADPALKSFFAAGEDTINITAAKIEKLKSENEALYKSFVQRVTQVLTPVPAVSVRVGMEKGSRLQ